MEIDPFCGSPSFDASLLAAGLLTPARNGTYYMEENRKTSRILCKRCLTKDLVGEEEYFRSLHDYIANLNPDIKADAPLYDKRLEVCRSCDMLLQGMCRSCGCYVELRAAISHNRCPHKKW
ncbi:MAG: DUF6171 family protein [Candidatus Gastranaerophilales bacterium]|nr:DUF6171 family protein [Candidatus Gastranaerophilales bacterium]